MSEEDERVLLETDTFLSSQVSFDIDEPLKPAHRKASRPSSRRPSKQPNPEESGDELVGSCPGCGSDIEESEFVEAILSFVTGAADYLGGDPVRVRSVQMLQQIISSGRLPDPHSEWTLEVVQRIEQHIEHMADERARLIRRQEGAALEQSLRFEIEKKVREELADTMRAEVEQEIVGEVAVAIRDQVRKQTIEEMVPLIRADLEKEMWNEFEAAMRTERAKNGGADEAE